MSRLAWIMGVMVVVAASGCSICCTPFDDAYPAYGGKWERTNRFSGRVGSAFDPAGGPVGETMSADELITEGGTYEEIETPTPAVPTPADAPPEEPVMPE